MSLTDSWTQGTPGSSSRINKQLIISDTGTNLAALNKANIRAVRCTATGSGLTVNHFYIVNAALDAFIDVSASGSHTHTSSADGGSLIDIFESNPKFMDLALTKTDELDKAKWIETLVTTGTTANDTDGTTGERSLKLLTGATSGGAATLGYPHLRLGFANRVIYQTKLRFSATTALAFHTGIDCDNVTAADSNNRKLQAEICTVTNNNWWLRTADNTASTGSDTGIAFSTTRSGIKIVHKPDLGVPETDLYIDAGTVLVKTTNIPVSSSSTDNNLIKHSLKNSAAADKNLFMYGCRLRYTIADDWV